MSKALDYLLQVRPDAMNSYFSFLKEAGKSLDPKTRSIISVITKVDNQTEAGLKQYLKRAIKAGVTPDEIVDALLLAFPTLGLTKILWALDIILGMELQEFEVENLVSNTEWQRLAAVSEINEGAQVMSLNQRALFIVKSGDSFQVFDTVCPHRSHRMNEENVTDNVLKCPGHGQTFDLTTGRNLSDSGSNLIRFESKIENNELYVYI
jgi:nitrite reductase/ring-hydroxylating ferredoxin subunit/alkylhydroperoxidase/carboxymuconolactone decarboxylase family protein YurZ